MTSLDQLVIEHIERSSRVTMPQEDRTLILDIVSRHEFDEDAARQFAEFYVNVNYRYGLSKELSEIKCPTLIIWGEKDLVLPISQAKAIKNIVKGSILRVVWGADHWPHLSRSREFLEVLDEYII